jgi:hypothetical protein
LIVDTETVTVGIGVGEETRLEDRVSGRLDVRNKMGWGKCDLFNLSKVVLRVLVENEFSNGPEREFPMRPNFCKVKDVIAELFSLLRCHSLDVDSPRGEVSVLDIMEKLLCAIIGIFSS